MNPGKGNVTMAATGDKKICVRFTGDVVSLGLENMFVTQYIGIILPSNLACAFIEYFKPCKNTRY